VSVVRDQSVLHSCQHLRLSQREDAVPLMLLSQQYRFLQTSFNMARVVCLVSKALYYCSAVRLQCVCFRTLCCSMLQQNSSTMFEQRTAEKSVCFETHHMFCCKRSARGADACAVYALYLTTDAVMGLEELYRGVKRMLTAGDLAQLAGHLRPCKRVRGVRLTNDTARGGSLISTALPSTASVSVSFAQDAEILRLDNLIDDLSGKIKRNNAALDRSTGRSRYGPSSSLTLGVARPYNSSNSNNINSSNGGSTSSMIANAPPRTVSR
jgi:hypothetical protein